MKRLIAVFMALIIVLAGCNLKSQSNLKRFEGHLFQYFDTVTNVIGYAENKEEFDSYMKIIESELKEYHKLYDIYNDYPDINNAKTINDNAGIAPVKIDDKLMSLLEISKDIYSDTNGKTNIALGSVLSIWHEYRTKGLESPESAQVPQMLDLQAAMKHTDINNLVLDKANGTAFITDPKMSLDLGSTGKGYAAEMVAQKLMSLEIDHVLISLGGNIRAVGSKPNGELWVTGLEDPFDKGSYAEIVNIEDISVVTSGDYQRYYMVDGKKYHHIIDPVTLMPADYFPATAVICENSGYADGYSTALFNMPFEDGIKWIESMDGVEAVWMLKDGSIKYSSGFEVYL